MSGLSSLAKTAGSYTATLTAAGSGVTDLAGNALASNATTSFSISAPAAPSAPALLAADDSGISSSDDITDVTTSLSYTGAAPAGNTVTLYSGSTQIGSGTATTGGTYSIATSSGFTAGTYTITAKDTDSYGNTSAASSSTTVVVDTIAPTASFTAVSPNPTPPPLSQLTINFSEPVYNLKLTAQPDAGWRLEPAHFHQRRHGHCSQSQLQWRKRHLDLEWPRLSH